MQNNQTTNQNDVKDELRHPSAIQQRISALRAENPDCVVVYFTKHKSAPESLQRPTSPLYFRHYIECFSKGA